MIIQVVYYYYILSLNLQRENSIVLFSSCWLCIFFCLVKIGSLSYSESEIKDINIIYTVLHVINYFKQQNLLKIMYQIENVKKMSTTWKQLYLNKMTKVAHTIMKLKTRIWRRYWSKCLKYEFWFWQKWIGLLKNALIIIFRERVFSWIRKISFWICRPINIHHSSSLMNWRWLRLKLSKLPITKSSGIYEKIHIFRRNIGFVIFNYLKSTKNACLSY